MAIGHGILIIANPASGRGRGLTTASAVAGHLRRRGMDATIRHTSGRGDAERLAREACVGSDSRPACVVACGGDGTVQEVANALASLRRTDDTFCPTMGLAPAGRCNDFARVLEVSTEPASIAEVLAAGAPRKIDLGCVNGRYYCTVATLGIDAEVSSYVDSMKMPLRGTAAYVYGAFCVLARYRASAVRIEGDFGVIERPIFLASSANTSSYGGSIEIAPEASPTDGQLDLCIIEEVSKLRALTLVLAVLLGKHVSQPEVSFIRTSRVKVESARRLELWADGEQIASTPATIAAVPGALRIVLPARRDSNQ